MKIALAAVLSIAFAGPVSAAASPDPSCSWTPSSVASGEVSTATVINMPTDRLFTYTFSPYPRGVTLSTTDGTYSVEWIVGETTTIYFWTRGGGGGLFKPGKQLNDYHPVAICTVTVV